MVRLTAALGVDSEREFWAHVSSLAMDQSDVAAEISSLASSGEVYHIHDLHDLLSSFNMSNTENIYTLLFLPNGLQEQQTAK